MNIAPVNAVRVPADQLRSFVRAVLDRAGMGATDAALLAKLLIENDLRGVFSHGSRQAAGYARELLARHLNPRPCVRVEAASTTLVVDGDGGLGYFAAHAAVLALRERAKEAGIAAAVTRSHGHIGAAGLYTRILAGAGLIAYCTSGHQLRLRPGEPFTRSAGGSPHSFAAPAGQGAPFVVDFGAMLDLYDGDPYGDVLFRLAPGLVFRSIGLGCVCQWLGGFLAGVPASPERAEREFASANQGAFLLAVDVQRFLPLGDFLREMDDYRRQVHELGPMPGYDKAMLPGEPEWHRERAWAMDGIPVGDDHACVLRAIADEVGVASPV